MQSSNLEAYKAARHEHVAQHVETESHNWIQEIAEAFDAGYSQGHGIACHNVPQIGDKLEPWLDWVGYDRVAPDNIRDVHEMLSHDAEMNARCFSPWEFIAHDINTAAPEGEEWLTEVLWDSYEAGVSAAIAHDFASYTDSDYGIEEHAE